MKRALKILIGCTAALVLSPFAAMLVRLEQALMASYLYGREEKRRAKNESAAA